MTTEIPPVMGPDPGDTSVTVGMAKYVNRSLELVFEVPPGLVTVTSTVDAPSADVSAVMEDALSTVNDEAGIAPNVTLLTAAKLVPLMVTDVPPATGPAPGATLETVGVAK
jgi:hypothetical protein